MMIRLLARSSCSHVALRRHWPAAAAAATAVALTTTSTTSTTSATSVAAHAAADDGWRRFAVEMGVGTSLRREDHTAAAIRALQDALWRVSFTGARALGQEGADMRVEVMIGVPKPEEVDEAAVLAVLPYGERSLTVVRGGMAIPGGCGADAQGDIIMANAAAIVSLNVRDYLEATGKSGANPARPS